ncbi:MAG: DNA internalization-related competence protein ComEC/Rec2 [Myxococcales bacterium]|nr:DNA internalization-related competence protein ComEC/Rec2 [Myxococcales bacterium]
MTPSLPGIACAWAVGIVFAELGALPAPLALLTGAAALGTGIGVPALRAHAVLWTAVAGGALALAVGADGDRLPRQPVESTLEGRVRGGGQHAGLAWLELEGVAGSGPVQPPERLRLVEVLDETGAAPGLQGFAALPGQRLRARALLRAPQPPRNPGTRDLEAAMRRSGREGRAWLVDPELLVAQGVPSAGAKQTALRLRARRLAALSGTGDARALLRALGLGDRSSLSQETREQFRSLGIGHLLAVSGLHLALVAGLAYRILARLLRGSAMLSARVDTRRWALFTCLWVAGVYALLTGFAVPVRRAWVFLAVGAGAALLVRPGRPAGRLAAAALAVLVAEPAALFEPGAQLSFAAAAALVAGVDAGARDGKHSLLWASATAMAVTAPLAAWHFGSSAPAGLIVNLVAIPWTGLVLLPAALAAVVLSALPGDPASGLGLEFCEALAGLSLAGVERLAAVLPGARATPTADVWVLAAGALGLATACTKRTHWRVLGALTVSGLLAVAPPQRFEPAPPRAVVLDVGQGDAVLVQGSQAALLVDAGGALAERWDRGERDVLPALAALGVSRLDLVVASHGDLDHRGGLPAVLRGIEVGRVWLPLGRGDSPDFEALRAVARRHGIPVEERGAGSPSQQFGDLHVSPLWPPPSYEAASRNDASLVVRVERGPRSLLLPGDLEARGEAALLASDAPLAAEVLLVPHHGSRSSSTPAFLAAVGARLAVISAPCVGRFPTPHAEVLTRLRARGTQVWWTGRDGAVRLSLGSTLAVRGQGRRREGCGSR